MKQLIYVNLGQIKYQQAWEIQKKLVKLRYELKIPDCLIVCEHDPVITMGRGTDKNNLLVSKEALQEKGIDLCEVERGGDITFHGPGQIILYPIVDLKNREKDSHKYLRDLESVAIKALDKLGMKAEIKKGLTGIWVNDQKIGAIGVALSRWVTYHGMALNVNTDLDHYRLIIPCGITEYPVGSVSEILSKTINIDNIKELLVENFVRYFGYDEITVKEIDQILQF
ncbi:MAG: lipoyl(octanoyl) transferase LipB [candidate division Zixibacteria bacterium]|nr:lipoyl(octanoyl) transferase LipB [candidate division Zixibacteria bacterium]